MHFLAFSMLDGGDWPGAVEIAHRSGFVLFLAAERFFRVVFPGVSFCSVLGMFHGWAVCVGGF